jgi:hypothetical protein
MPILSNFFLSCTDLGRFLFIYRYSIGNAFFCSHPLGNLHLYLLVNSWLGYGTKHNGSGGKGMRERDWMPKARLRFLSAASLETYSSKAPKTINFGKNGKSFFTLTCWRKMLLNEVKRRIWKRPCAMLLCWLCQTLPKSSYWKLMPLTKE